MMGIGEWINLFVEISRFLGTTFCRLILFSITLEHNGSLRYNVKLRAFSHNWARIGISNMLRNIAPLCRLLTTCCLRILSIKIIFLILWWVHVLGIAQKLSDVELLFRTPYCRVITRSELQFGLLIGQHLTVFPCPICMKCCFHCKMRDE